MVKHTTNLQEWQFQHLQSEIAKDETDRELAFRDARYIENDWDRLQVYYAKMDNQRFDERDLRDLQGLLKKFCHNDMTLKQVYHFVDTWGC